MAMSKKLNKNQTTKLFIDILNDDVKKYGVYHFGEICISISRKGMTVNDRVKRCGVPSKMREIIRTKK